MGGVSPKRESAGEYRGGRALQLSREAGNPLKARLKRKSRYGWRARLGAKGGELDPPLTVAI